MSLSENPFYNAPAPNVPYFTPKQDPPAGSARVPQPDDKPIPKLFQPIKIRGVEFHNRIFVRVSTFCVPRIMLIVDVIIAFTALSVLHQEWCSHPVAHGPLYASRPT